MEFYSNAQCFLYELWDYGSGLRMGPLHMHQDPFMQEHSRGDVGRCITNVDRNSTSFFSLALSS